MKRTIYTMALAALMLAGCAQEENMGLGEEVRVTFTANMSTGIQSRAGESVPAADRMICAVFDESGANQLLRDTVQVTNGSATFDPVLLKGDTYRIVFWAYKADDDGGNRCYDMNDLTAIKFIPTGGSEIEVFTETLTGVTVNNADGKVTLTRPLAQVNWATSVTDWENAAALGKTPDSSVLTLEGCFDMYNAPQGTWSSSTTDGAKHTYTTANLTKEDVLFTGKDGKQYVRLASGYTFGQNTITCELSVKDESSEEMFGYTIGNVSTDANYRTNICSENLMTGKVTFTVSVEEGYSEEDKYKEIQ